MSLTFKVGDATIHRIIEMECGFTPALEFLPNLTKEQLDENRSWLSPAALDANDNLVLCFQSYLVQIAGQNILVDSCVGNDKDRAARPLWHRKKDNAFMSGLKRAGIGPDDIDYVMCTHLHVDHVGWNTKLENGRWVPTFPKARYLFAKTELDFWLAENAKAEVAPIADSVVPIVEAKACDIITSDYSLNDLVSVFPSPGHTIDHYGVKVGKPGAPPPAPTRRRPPRSWKRCPSRPCRQNRCAGVRATGPGPAPATPGRVGSMSRSPRPARTGCRGTGSKAAAPMCGSPRAGRCSGPPAGPVSRRI